MTHGRADAETARSRWMLGRAMFATESSRTSISCAVAMTTKDSPSPRPPGDAPDGPACMGSAVFDIEALLTGSDGTVGTLPGQEHNMPPGGISTAYLSPR